MPQEVKFPIKVDGMDKLKRLVSVLKNVQQAAANANAVSNNQSAAAVHGKMMAAAQKATVRTRAAAMSVRGVYGAGGSNQYSGYKPSAIACMAAAHKANVQGPKRRHQEANVQDRYGGQCQELGGMGSGSKEVKARVKPSGVGGGTEGQRRYGCSGRYGQRRESCFWSKP